MRVVDWVRLARARALRRWWYRIFHTVRSNNLAAFSSFGDHDWTTAPVAANTWQTVTSGFFPPSPWQTTTGNR
ncbi:MAG: hypothetical protein GYA33_13465 [Thermogutta sp.]|nr:hypothetical protein [Thermogutta sp.]